MGLCPLQVKNPEPVLKQESDRIRLLFPPNSSSLVALWKIAFFSRIFYYSQIWWV